MVKRKVLIGKGVAVHRLEAISSTPCYGKGAGDGSSRDIPCHHCHYALQYEQVPHSIGSGTYL